MINRVLLRRQTTRVVHWMLVAILIFYAVSGFGITQFRIVEQITFGLLTKLIAFRMHDYLLIPFILLLILHIWQVIGKSK